MEIEILSKEKNPFFKRDEINFEIKGSTTVPSRKELREKLAALLNVNIENVIVDKIEHSFGMQDSKGFAKVYSSKEIISKLELPHIVGRNLGQKKKSGEKAATETGKPVEAAPAAAPPEKPKAAAPEKKASAPAVPATEKKVEAEKKPEAEKKAAAEQRFSPGFQVEQSSTRPRDAAASQGSQKAAAPEKK